MKRLIKAILWIVCYGGACWFGIKSKLGFDIISQDHWKLLFDKSIHAHWPSEMAAKKLVCKILLAFIVVGILGLAVVTKKKKTRIPIVKGELPSKSDSRPAFMTSQGKISSSPTPPPSTPTPNTGSNFSAPVSNPPSVNLMSDAIRQITNIANTFDVSVFPHVKLENTFTQLIISDDATALLLKILPQQGTWHITQNELPEESLWALEQEPPKNILKDIINSTATLARLEPDAQAISVILIAGGTIENPAEIKNYLNQNGIRIAALGNQNMPDIPTWEELLNNFYPPKEEENQDETGNSEQNM